MHNRDRAGSWWYTPVIPIVRVEGWRVNGLRPTWATRDPVSMMQHTLEKKERKKVKYKCKKMLISYVRKVF